MPVGDHCARSCICKPQRLPVRTEAPRPPSRWQGSIDCEAAVISPLRRKRACLDGAPDVDSARSGPFHRLHQAQNCHRALSPTKLLGKGSRPIVNKALRLLHRCRKRSTRGSASNARSRNARGFARCRSACGPRTAREDRRRRHAFAIAARWRPFGPPDDVAADGEARGDRPQSR